MADKGNDYVIFGIDFGQNPEQREMIRLINEDASTRPVVFVKGSAGTGKTFAALAASLNLVKGRGTKKKYDTIYYIREPVEVGHRLGYLKGTEEDKYAPYIGPLLDNLLKLSEYVYEAGQAYVFKGRNPDNGDFDNPYNKLPKEIVPLPPEFIRGRSFSDSIIIVDEAQNLTLEELQTLVTRIGERCKMIILGSPNQIDVDGQTEEHNAFDTAYEILESSSLVSRVTLCRPMRSSFVVDFDERFVAYRKAHPKKK